MRIVTNFIIHTEVSSQLFHYSLSIILFSTNSNNKASRMLFIINLFICTDHAHFQVKKICFSWESMGLQWCLLVVKHLKSPLGRPLTVFIESCYTCSFYGEKKPPLNQSLPVPKFTTGSISIPNGYFLSLSYFVA